MNKRALTFKILAECPVTKARVSKMHLPHHTVDTPVFMPVGTQGTLKGMTSQQLLDMDCQIILGNTYHLGNRPGCDILKKAGGLHQFMGWNRALLTDSGGFQMVSLLELAEITEEGVKFQSPHDGSEMLLTPEQSIAIQNTIGADVIMQLDDVIHVLTTGPRVQEACHRSIRWLDRCIQAHARPHEQALFGIVQGGLDLALRKECAMSMCERNLLGYAIGGLSGGEAKDVFWRIVSLCTDLLPNDKPRYLMGVGFAADLVVCSALGIDMYDCVYPSRTARCGVALVPWGKINITSSDCASKFVPVDPDCACRTCQDHTLSSLHLLMTTKEVVGCSLLTVHNIHYQLTLMRELRQSILKNEFVDFVRNFMKRLFPDGNYEQWIVDALESVNISLQDTHHHPAAAATTSPSTPNSSELIAQSSYSKLGH